MPSKLSLRAKGLYTWPNPLIEVPEGGMVIAKNVVIDRESTVEPRRGYSELDYPLGNSSLNIADQILTFGSDDFIAHYGPLGSPSKLAFFSFIVDTTGTFTNGSNVVNNIPSTSGMYVGQVMKQVSRETIFLGDQVFGTNSIINLLSSQGLFVGMSIGGAGIPLGSVITSITGTGPYSITISNNVLLTQQGNTLTATDSNLAPVPDGTTITSISSGSITLSANATLTSPAINFIGSDVNTITDTININNHGLADGDVVQFTTTGSLPAPLNNFTVYFVTSSNSASFKVALSDGGTPVNLTSHGTGTHSLIIRDEFTVAGWIDYPGTFIKPDANVKMRYAESNASLYFTTDEGIKVIDNIEGLTFKGDVTSGSNIVTNVDVLDVTIGESIGGTGIPNGTIITALLSQTSFQMSNNATISAAGQKIFVQPRLAGLSRALDGTAYLTTDATGFLSADKAIAYKIVWGRKNINNKIYQGAPSTDINVSNTTVDAKNVHLSFSVPANITSGYFYRIYRTGFSANASSVPTQDYALIYEASPTFQEVSDEVVNFLDNVPETLRTGAALYTNESQEGALYANFTPPFATDVTSYKECLFLSNTKTNQNMALTINSISGQFSVLGDINNASAFKSKTIANPSLDIFGDTTSGSNLITNVSSIDMGAIAVGQGITGAGIPANTVIAALTSASSFALTNAATATAAGVNFNLDVVGVQIGQTVLGANIPANTVVTSLFQPATFTLNTTNGSPIISSFVSTAGLKVGQPVSAGAGIPVGTQILSVDSNTQITLTDNATATIIGAVVTFGTGARISNGATATTVGETITLKNGSAGIEVGDTITVSGVTYTANTVEDYTGSNRLFKVYAHGSPSQNIADTAYSLIRVVNRQQSASGNPDVYAFYNSAVSDLPGQLLFVSRSLNANKFYANADSTSSGAAYTPNLPAAGAFTVHSKNDELPNGLSYSKASQPESFPLGYNFPIGKEKEAILRIIALRDSLFTLKNDGVFRLTGVDPTSFRNTIFDNTIKLAAPESAVSLSNTIFCLSTEGVVSISDSNIQIMSRPIEDLILDAFEASQTKVRTLSHAVAYTSDRKYILFTITTSQDTTATQAFVYNTFTNTWTTWAMSRTCGAVIPGEDLLYLGRADKNTFKVERKDRKYTDYLEDTFTKSISQVTGVVTSGSTQITLILPDTQHFTVGQTISGTGIPDGAAIAVVDNNFTITMNQPATTSGVVQIFVEDNQVLRMADVNNIQVGDALYQNSGRFALITAVDPLKKTITTRIPINSWTAGTSTILQAIETEMKYVPQTCGNPAALKQVTQFIALFQAPQFDQITISFDTDLSGGEESVILYGQIGGILWGLYPWGQVIWGGITRPVPLRTLIPQAKQRNTQLNIKITHREAYAFYRLSGIDLHHNEGSERVRR